MKKLLLFIGLIFTCGVSHAFNINHILFPQYRVWKSSALDPAASYSGVQISTSPIIFHMIIGSGTISAGLGAFTLLQSTGMTSMSSDASTKAIIPLDNTNSFSDKIGYPVDIMVTTHSYFNKSGSANIQYLWDYLDGGVQVNKYPKD